jgi:hypothetical protein
MGRRNTVISLAVLLLCGGILVLFTDLELSAVRWLNCGPWASHNERRSELCR